MSLKAEGGTQAQDPQLVALEEEIKEVRDDIKDLKRKIKAFDEDNTPKDEITRLSHLEDKRRLTGLEADLRTLKAQVSSATSTAQQGK
jgi:capsule polysaccharide export protein KpsE/RkpR